MDEEVNSVNVRLHVATAWFELPSLPINLLTP